MSGLSAFQQLQNQFAAHLRAPLLNAPPPGIEARRLAVYNELFFNNVEGAISGAFPVLKRISSEAAFAARVRRFYAEYGAHTPLFHQLAGEFVQWLEASPPQPDDPPFLLELAHYEWVELELSLRLASPLAPAAEVLDSPLAVSPLAWPLAYAFAVHKIGPDYLPQQPGDTPTCLVVYRDAEDSVRFMETNPLTNRLLEQLEQLQPPCTGRKALLALAQELGYADASPLLAQGEVLLATLHQRGIIGAAPLLTLE